MDSNNAPNAQPRVTATIDIPDPPPWRVLEGDANTQDYGWRQPRYNAQVMERGFDDDIEAVLLNPALPFGFHFLTAAVLVGELERLADSRQTKFEGKPMKDGSNLWEFNRSPDTEEVEVVNGSEGLRHMYHYSKDVLEMLYRNNLVTIEENTANPTIEEMLRNLDQQQCHRLYDLLIRGCYSAAAYEAARLRDPAFGPAFALGFEWVPAFRESVRDGMLSIQAALWWSIEHAYDPIPHMQQAMEMVPSVTRLLMYLLTREAKFERTLAKEHVEDILIDKRIHWLSPGDMFKLGGSGVRAFLNRYDVGVKPRLEEWQNRIRICFDYRMLRDWGYGRHWKKMYVVIDEPPEGQAAIHMFRNWASNNSKLAYDMFAVHPIFKGEVPDGDICSICYCDWEDTELVMELHCGHRFHPNCIYTHWDNYTIFSNPCCNCRQSQGWLKDRMDFQAQKEDKDYPSNNGAMAQEDKNLDYGIWRCITENWPGGLRALDPKHQERYWRNAIEPERTARRVAREVANPGYSTLE